MEQPQNFRSAFNGFNREDVVHYLEYLKSRNANIVAQLTAEAEQLRKKLDAVTNGELSDQRRQCRELNVQLETVQMEKAAQAARADSLEQELLAVRQELEQMRVQRDAARAHSAELENRAQEELDAYRRAERAERTAKERADQIYRHTNGILAETTVLVDDASQQVSSVSQNIMDQLSRLQNAVAASRQALEKASAVMYGLRPDDTNQN